MVARWKEAGEGEPVLEVNVVCSPVWQVDCAHIRQLIVVDQIVNDMFPSNQRLRHADMRQQLIGIAFQIPLNSLFDSHCRF